MFTLIGLQSILEWNHAVQTIPLNITLYEQSLILYCPVCGVKLGKSIGYCSYCGHTFVFPKTNKY